MKYFQIEGIINNELLNKFIYFINQYETEKKTLILDSVGGKQHISRFLLNIINQNKDKFTLVLLGGYSAAFYIFYFAKCKKLLVKNAMGMIHYPYNKDISIDDRGKPVFSEDEYTLKNNDKSQSDFVKEFMNASELRKFKQGKDVYFTFKRLKEIFNNAEVID